MKMKMLCGLLLGTLALAGSAVGQTPVKFTVDMSVQIAASNFNPTTMGVEVRGPFNGWAGTALTREGTTSNYSGTISVTGALSSAVAYKYYGTGAGGLSWESFSGDRTFNLGPAGATQVLDTVYFNNQGPTGPTVTVPVKFSVDMAVQIAGGNFNVTTQSMLVRGGFNGWGEGSALVREGTTTIYSGTFSVTGAQGGAIAYKFYKTGIGDAGYESIGDRSFNLGPAGATQVLATVYFNDQAPANATVDVVFSVNMEVQIGLGNFNPDTMGVQARGPFNGWAGTALVREGATAIYSGTISVTGTAGGAVPYKFYNTGMAGDAGYESIADRSFTLGANGTTQVLATVYFNNQAPAGPTLTFTGGTWDPAAVGAYPFELTRSGAVGDEIVLSSSNPSAVTVPASVSFAAGSNVVSFNATVVSLTAGEATIVASNVASGASAEYTVRPVAPGLSFTSGTWNPSTPGGYLYRLERVGAVGDEIVLTSTASNVLTAAPSVNFTAGTNAIDILATVVSVTNGPATLIASNVASGAWAEYVVTPVGPVLTIGGPFLVESLGALTYTLERTPSVGVNVLLSSSDTNVLTVPADLLFGAGSYTSTFPATAVGYGAAKIVASNASSGVWAEYNVTVQMPTVGPPIAAITYVPGAGTFSFTVPTGFTLFSVQAADTSAPVVGDLGWTDLVPVTDYTVAAGVVTIPTANPAPLQRLIRIWVTVSPP